jgi:hypothetical protein
MTTYTAADGNLHTTVTASSIARLLNKEGFNRRQFSFGYEIDDTMGWLRVSHFDLPEENEKFISALYRLGFAFAIESEWTDYDGIQLIELRVSARRVEA